LESGKVVYGIKETMKMLDTGAISDLLLAETLNWVRIELLDSKKNKRIEYLMPEDLTTKKFIDEDTGEEMEKATEEP